MEWISTPTSFAPGTDKKLNGEGVRLGTAYQLNDGRVVYVPEN